MKKVYLLAVILFFVSFALVHATTLFYVDFEDGNTNGWIYGKPSPEYRLGNWRIFNGVLLQDDGGDAHKFLVDSAPVSDQSLEVKVYFFGPSGYGGATVWYKDADNWIDIRIYPAATDTDLWIGENINGTKTTSMYQYSAHEAQWHTLKVDADSTTGELAIYMDGTLLVTHQTIVNYRSGLSGVMSGNAGGYFDDFRLTSSATPAPTPTPTPSATPTPLPTPTPTPSATPTPTPSPTPTPTPSLTPTPTPTPTVRPAPTPICESDAWDCTPWNACAQNGLQTRTCSRTFDCPSIEDAPPVTAQTCEVPGRQNQAPPQTGNVPPNQDSVLKATVKLICPINNTEAYTGSGTIIDSVGTILTNRHVIEGTPGCWVGLISKATDLPVFSDRYIALIYRQSTTIDAAILKLQQLPPNMSYVSIGGGSSNNLTIGARIHTYGYPGLFGKTITYTSGDYSGYYEDGGYLKTSAVLDHGNSGGGAYLIDGTYIGMPSAGIIGEANTMGLILPIDQIKNWMNGSGIPYAATMPSIGFSATANILRDTDLSKLGTLQYIAATVITEASEPAIPEGAIIRAKGDFDVYIVKYVGTKKFKRLVLSPAVFKNYGHLKWENVIEVDPSTRDAFTTSELVRAVGDSKVYKLYPSGDTGQKKWVKTSDAFLRMGFDWDAVYEINTFDRNSYITGSALE